MHFSRMKLFVAALAMGLGCSAQAGMIIDSSPSSTASTVNHGAIKEAPRPVITHIGALSTNVKRVTTSAHNESVALVLSKLVPKGWSGYAADPSIKTITNVSYVGANRPWPVVLEEVLSQHGLLGKINWDKSEISVEIAGQIAK